MEWRFPRADAMNEDQSEVLNNEHEILQQSRNFYHEN